MTLNSMYKDYQFNVKDYQLNVKWLYLFIADLIILKKLKNHMDVRNYHRFDTNHLPYKQAEHWLIIMIKTVCDKKNEWLKRLNDQRKQVKLNNNDWL